MVAAHRAFFFKPPGWRSRFAASLDGWARQGCERDAVIAGGPAATKIPSAAELDANCQIIYLGFVEICSTDPLPAGTFARFGNGDLFNRGHSQPTEMRTRRCDLDHINSFGVTDKNNRDRNRTI